MSPARKPSFKLEISLKNFLVRYQGTRWKEERKIVVSVQSAQKSFFLLPLSNFLEKHCNSGSLLARRLARKSEVEKAL